MSSRKRTRSSFFSQVTPGAVTVYKDPRAYKRPRRTRSVPAGIAMGRYAGRSELKFHDVDLTDAVVAAGTNVTASVNLIAQGITESTRIGRKCTLKSIGWRYRLLLPEVDAAATPLSGDNVRVIMYLDKQANGATAAGTDLLESADVHSFLNLANSGRFVVLLDKLYPMNYSTLASDGAGVVSQTRMSWEKTFFKTCNIPIEFSGVAGIITEIRSNNIGVILVGNTGEASFSSKIRLRFSDM